MLTSLENAKKEATLTILRKNPLNKPRHYFLQAIHPQLTKLTKLWPRVINRMVKLSRRRSHLNNAMANSFFWMEHHSKVCSVGIGLRNGPWPNWRSPTLTSSSARLASVRRGTQKSQFKRWTLSTCPLEWARSDTCFPPASCSTICRRHQRKCDFSSYSAKDWTTTARLRTGWLMPTAKFKTNSLVRSTSLPRETLWVLKHATRCTSQSHCIKSSHYNPTFPLICQLPI